MYTKHIKLTYSDLSCCFDTKRTALSTGILHHANNGDTDDDQSLHKHRLPALDILLATYPKLIHFHQTTYRCSLLFSSQSSIHWYCVKSVNNHLIQNND